MNGARAQLAERVRVGAKLAAREHLDVNLAARLSLDPLCSLGRLYVQRMGRWLIVGKFVHELGRLGTRTAAHQDCRGSPAQHASA